MFSTMTLNLWAYNDWSNRKQNIFKLIDEFKPDIFTLQEVRLDAAHSIFPQSQEIADKCGYKFHTYSPAWSKISPRNTIDHSTIAVSHGLSVISKFPITNVSTQFLKTHPDFDEPCIVMYANIDVKGESITICNVHFVNRDKFADLHLKELINVCKLRDQNTVIQGDFNIFKLSDYRLSILQGYELSIDKVHYESFPRDKATLDYIIVPSSKYEIEEVTCSNTYVSDHNAVMAKINKRETA